MSRSTPRSVGTSNPVKLEVSFKPNDGDFVIYDKANKEKVVVKSLEVVILEGDTKGVVGFSEQHGVGFVSNYIYNPAKEPFKVGVFKNGKYDSVQEGIWKEIKDKLVGAKYARVIFGLVKFNKEWQFSKIELTGKGGAYFGDWFGSNKTRGEKDIVLFGVSDDIFMKDVKSGNEVVVPEDKKKKWMTTWFHKLEFDFKDIDDVTDALAFEQSKVFDTWIGTDKPKEVDEEPTGNVTNASAPDEDEDDDLPF